MLADSEPPRFNGARMNRDTNAAELRGWVLYDGSCGFCGRWVTFWRGTLRAQGLGIAALQEPWVAERLATTEKDRLSDLRILFADGGQVRGADAYRHVLRRIWWALPLYLFSIAPMTRRVFDWCYRRFANHRHRISRACRLPGR